LLATGYWKGGDDLIDEASSSVADLVDYLGYEAARIKHSGS
jgi:hypothetical protein